MLHSIRLLRIYAPVLIGLGLVAPSFGKPPQKPLSFRSPNGRIAATLDVKDVDQRQACLVYSIAYDDQPLVADSRIRFRMADAPQLGDNLELVSSELDAEINKTWQPVYGERDAYVDHYRLIKASYRETQQPRRTIAVELRVYDEGVAFRVTIDGRSAQQAKAPPVEIAEELTEFTFLADHTAWVAQNAQGEYAAKTISTLGDEVERPLTLCTQAASGKTTYVAVAEAALVDYARMKLRRSHENPLQIVSQLSGSVRLASPATTPWRVVMIADSPGELLENNYLILNLNEPCAIEDVSWIKPGKVIREITLTDKGAEACIDFAVKHNLQYVEFDAGWYGHEYDDASDATTVTVDPQRSAGPLDLKKHIKNANAQGLGVILYVNRRALEKQLDEILPLFKSWGVAGVKYGFVRVGSQQWTRWLHEAIQKAADHELMVDVHDEYRPTGYSRTYPNFMTCEGIRGDEASPSNELTLEILYSRMLAGSADNTICYFADRVEANQNHAAQLAKSIILYSPWQFLFWYDAPAASLPLNSNRDESVIQETPELELWDHMPTVWNDTRVLAGEIGKYAVVARRSGDDWYLGALNSSPTRLSVSLDFLDAGRQYVACVYAHDEQIDSRTHVKIERKQVDHDTILDFDLEKDSGQAIRITPVTGSQTASS